MIGANRAQLSVILEPYAAFGGSDPRYTTSEAFVDEVWPFVEKANAEQAESSTRVAKGLILVADIVKKPIPRTPKGTVNRMQAGKLYSEELDALYRAVWTVRES